MGDGRGTRPQMRIKDNRPQGWAPTKTIACRGRDKKTCNAPPPTRIQQLELFVFGQSFRPPRAKTPEKHPFAPLQNSARIAVACPKHCPRPHAPHDHPPIPAARRHQLPGAAHAARQPRPQAARNRQQKAKMFSNKKQPFLIGKHFDRLRADFPEPIPAQSTGLDAHEPTQMGPSSRAGAHDRRITGHPQKRT